MKFPGYRRLTRTSGAKLRVRRKQRYTVQLRFHPSDGNRPVDEDLLYGHLLRLIHKLGGFRLAEEFEFHVVRREKWHRLPYRVRPNLLKEFLLAVDRYCEQGWMEVDINGVLMARSKPV